MPYYPSCQDSGTVGANESAEERRQDATYHTTRAGKIEFKNLDPSMALVRGMIRSFIFV